MQNRTSDGVGPVGGTGLLLRIHQRRGTALRRLAAILPGLVLTLAPRSADAIDSTGIIVETVNNYTWWQGCGAGQCDTICNSEGDNFWSVLTLGGSGYSASVHYKDNSVFDRDFHDPQYTGNPADNDTYNFDKAAGAISYACGHGTCGDVTTTNCNTDADCPAGSYCPRMPPVSPIVENKVCITEAQRQFVTSSTVNSHGNIVAYGRTYPASSPVSTIALGEDAASGAFAGAGTNGGTNLAFIVNSCGLRSQYWSAATLKLFAGVHSIHMLVPVAAWEDIYGNKFASDARTEPQRGYDVALAAWLNPNSAVSDAWLNSTQAGDGQALWRRHARVVPLGLYDEHRPWQHSRQRDLARDTGDLVPGEE